MEEPDFEFASQPARREVELLYRVAQELLSTERHLGLVLKAILAHMAQVAGMERGMITVLDPSRDVARVDVAHGLSAEQQARGRYQLGEGVIGKVLDRGEPAVVPRIGDEPLFLDRTASRANLDRSKIAFLCVPIAHRGEVIGTLSVDRVSGAAEISFEDDLRLLMIIAMMAVGESVIMLLHGRGGMVGVEVGAVLGLIGIWSTRAANEFGQVARTTGSDIAHLIGALREIKKLYDLQFWAFLGLGTQPWRISTAIG